MVLWPLTAVPEREGPFRREGSRGDKIRSRQEELFASSSCDFVCRESGVYLHSIFFLCLEYAKTRASIVTVVEGCRVILDIDV